MKLKVNKGVDKNHIYSYLCERKSIPWLRID